jgi:hypothetical protein
MEFLVAKFSLFSYIYIYIYIYTVVELYRSFSSNTPALHCVKGTGVRVAYLRVS